MLDPVLLAQEVWVLTRSHDMQIKALLISTAVTTAAGAAVLLGIRSAGVDAHSVATVSSWQTAVLVAQQQRVGHEQRPMHQ